jgi:hypothetical protein
MSSGVPVLSSSLSGASQLIALLFNFSSTRIRALPGATARLSAQLDLTVSGGYGPGSSSGSLNTFMSSVSLRFSPWSCHVVRFHFEIHFFFSFSFQRFVVLVFDMVFSICNGLECIFCFSNVKSDYAGQFSGFVNVFKHSHLNCGILIWFQLCSHSVPHGLRVRMPPPLTKYRHSPPYLL